MLQGYARQLYLFPLDIGFISVYKVLLKGNFI